MSVKEQNRRQLLYQTFIITLSKVQGVSQLLSKGELFISSPRQTTKTTWSFCLSIHSWIILCWLQSSLASLSSFSIRSDTVEQFFIHETARCSSPSGFNRTVLCLLLTSHSCHFKSCFFVRRWCPPSFLHSSSSSSSLRSLKRSLITRCCGWTCRRQEFSFRENLAHRGLPECIFDWN